MKEINIRQLLLELRKPKQPTINCNPMLDDKPTLQISSYDIAKQTNFKKIRSDK